jgi:hypothetical protein
MSLAFLNKVQTTFPLFLLEGCDGSTGKEMAVTLAITFSLAFVLCVIEPRYQASTRLGEFLKLALFCAGVTVFALIVELNIFQAIGTLKGIIGQYSIPSVILLISVVLSVFALVTAWCDQKSLLKVTK